MYRHYHEISKSVLTDIQEYENQQLSKFQKEFDCLFAGISNLYGWNYAVNVHRWIDRAVKWRNKRFDGYTAMLQVDFTDSNGNLIEIDENVCSFFENITFIEYYPILRKYKVYQKEELRDIRKEIERFLQLLDKSH